MASNRDADDFARRRDAERARQECEAPKRIDGVLVEAINRLCDSIDKAKHPIELKRQLANVVQSRVRCPGFHRAEAEKAAGYVVEPYPGEPALPLEVLERLLNELDDADQKGQVSPYIEGEGGGRGRWFNGVLKRRLRNYGIRQRKKGVRRT